LRVLQSEKEIAKEIRCGNLFSADIQPAPEQAEQPNSGKSETVNITENGIKKKGY
jgi:hypothetical protein